MIPGALSFLLACGYTLDDGGRPVPLSGSTLSPAERFALDAARMTELRTRRDGPSPKSERRRERLAARARKS